MLAAKIVYDILGELRCYKGLDIEEIIDDEDIYEDVINTLSELVDDILHDALEKLLDG